MWKGYLGMKDFNPEAKCPKCGFDDINTQYFPRIDWISCCDYSRTYNEKQLLKEHLKRYCTRCHFAWPENIIKETKRTNILTDRLPFRIEGSLEGGPDIIIVDRNGKEIGDLYTTREEAKEIINIINSYKGN